MAVTTRTNRASNPSATSTTNYTVFAGTSGAASLSNQTGPGPFGAGFNRSTWTTATTAVGGGISYTQTLLSPNVQYSHMVWVRSSKAQTLQLSAQYQNSSGSNVGSASTSSSASVTAGVWTAFTINGATSGAAVDRVILSVGAVAGGSSWAAGDTFDVGAVLIEASATAGSFFDGSFTAAANVVYAWAGAANASNSTATTYQPVVTVSPKTDAPCPRVEITVADLAPSNQVVNVWRTADSRRQAVRGARNRTMVAADFVIDYEAPLNRPLTYEVEIISGVNALAVVPLAATSVTSQYWWIQDPAVPSSAIALGISKQDSTRPYLAVGAVKSLDYNATVTVIPVMGSSEPVALMGNRQIAGNIVFDMFTNFASVTTQLRNLLRQTPLLAVRSTGQRNDGVPGLAYFASAKPSECPVTVAFGGTLTQWKLSGDLVAAPTMNVLVPIWTYGTVQALWATYQQAQTTLGGKTYLDVLKSPSGV
ncbi:MAG: hypothetical protein L0G87_01440 [Renibacterium salmoninarum]|nr:hypothetical protein [Renibacterium salmoninarum]